MISLREERVLYMNRTKYVVLVVLGVLWTGGICYGDDWPQFRGSFRDGLLCEGTPTATGMNPFRFPFPS